MRILFIFSFIGNVEWECDLIHFLFHSHIWITRIILDHVWCMGMWNDIGILFIFSHIPILDNSSKSRNEINNDSKVNEISLINRISIYPIIGGILIPSITYF